MQTGSILVLLTYILVVTVQIFSNIYRIMSREGLRGFDLSDSLEERYTYSQIRDGLTIPVVLSVITGIGFAIGSSLLPKNGNVWLWLEEPDELAGLLKNYIIPMLIFSLLIIASLFIYSLYRSKQGSVPWDIMIARRELAEVSQYDPLAFSKIIAIERKVARWKSRRYRFTIGLGVKPDGKRIARYFNGSDNKGCFIIAYLCSFKARQLLYLIPFFLFMTICIIFISVLGVNGFYSDVILYSTPVYSIGFFLCMFNYILLIVSDYFVLRRSKKIFDNELRIYRRERRSRIRSISEFQLDLLNRVYFTSSHHDYYSELGNKVGRASICRHFLKKR